MSLLQIHDPLSAPRPIGIDLGTTHSIVAYVPASGGPVAVSNCDGETLLPSVVRYRAEGAPVVGSDAKRAAVDAPLDTIVSVKRFMGRGGDDAETKKLGPYRFASDAGPVVQFMVAGDRVVTPVEVSAEILRELKDRAEDELGPVGGAVITVPAYFDDAQRQATKDAARLAGLTVLRLINEPTAAALAYGLETKKNGRFVVYDLGGGTFDVTLLDLEDGVFFVRATGGDSQLGGDDLDRVIADRILAALGGEASPSQVRYALDAAREIKHALTDSERVETELVHGALRMPFAMGRDEFDAAIAPLMERTGSAARRVLRDAAVTVDDLDGVILVGGSTRVPAVQAYVEKLFGQAPLRDLDPDLVVAMGAAVQADALAGQGDRQDVLLLDVLPLSLGIEAMGGVVERILPRNTAIPTEAGQVFTTYADQQTGFEIHVVQGERELAKDCRSLGRFTLRGIPPMGAGMARLEVRFRVDADGLLSVSAKERTTGIEQSIDVKPTYGLEDSDIERMLLEAYEVGEADVAARNLAERRIEASRVELATRKALAEDADLLSADERALIDSALDDMARARAGQDPRHLLATIDALETATHTFAGRRMDRAMQRALGGRALDAVASDTDHARGIERAHESLVSSDPER